MKMKFCLGFCLLLIVIFSVASADDAGYREIDLPPELQAGDMLSFTMSTAGDRFYVLDSYENKIISVTSDGKIDSMPSISTLDDGQYLSTLALTANDNEPYVVAISVEEGEDEVEFADAGLYHLDPDQGIGALVCTLDLQDVLYESAGIQTILDCTSARMDDTALFLLFSGKDMFAADMPEGSVLLQFDLSTGKKTLRDDMDPEELIFMRDGALLYSRTNADAQETEIVKYDLATGKEKTILSLPSNIPAPRNFVYDNQTNQLFFTSSNQFFGMKSPTSPAQLLSILPTKTVTGLAQISDTEFFAHDTKSVYQIEVDWDRRFEQQELAILGGYGGIYDYISVHPEVNLREMDDLESDDLIRLILTRSSTPDMICLWSDDPAFTSLKDRGYLQSIDSDAVRTYVSRLHLDIRSLVCVDEAPCAVPVSMLVQPMLGINEELWNRLELGNIPTSWSELIAFLETWPEISGQHPEISLTTDLTARENVRSIFVYAFMQDYEGYIGSDPELGYDTELFRSLASRLDAIQWDRIEFPYEAELEDCLFESAYSASPSPWVNSPKFHAMPLSVEDGENSHIVANVCLLLINPFSEHRALAEDCLEYIIQTIEPIDKIMLQADENAPIRASDYTEMVQEYEDKLSALDSKIGATEDEALKRELSWEADETRKELDDYIQNTSWFVSEQNIADYRAISEHIFMLNANDWDQETRNVIDQYRSQYLNREIDLDRFIASMDRMRAMKIAEGA